METRKIEFRGKTISGDWVKGLLAKTGGKVFISNSAGRPFAYEVRPETIGLKLSGKTADCLIKTVTKYLKAIF